MSTPTADARSIEQRKRRASYRAHYRGTKEMDWLVGKFADARLDAMDEGQLALFEILLAVPDPDLQSWIVDPTLVADRDIGPLVAEMSAFHDLSPRATA
ncbi:MAG TPA: succinate dehydrogenase assembly factor 2 [Hyphomicrobiaceae bacterium]|nr:succinate dehydrogenase assembly factor 2 [Hyphomicrobiaceae bacterium]